MSQGSSTVETELGPHGDQGPVPLTIHSLPFTGMTFRSWREGPSGVVRDTSAPQRDRGGCDNYKSFLVKALRKGDLGLIFRCGLEETVNSFNSPKLFLTGTQKEAGVLEAVAVWSLSLQEFGALCGGFAVVA